MDFILDSFRLTAGEDCGPVAAVVHAVRVEAGRPHEEPHLQGRRL